jgi:ABC-type Fe3+/spermidine/putrescine transport system ATPase subunit
LLKVLAGLDKPSHGQVFYNELNATDVSVKKRGFSMV